MGAPTHRQRYTSVYEIWKSMRKRCRNPNDNHYANYGGRGIRVCERWESFEVFSADMGPKPFGFCIERLNNNGDYEPDNCIWASRVDQNNNRRSNHFVELRGKRMTLSQAIRVSGASISSSTLSARLRSGWNLETALSLPRLSGREAAACRKIYQIDPESQQVPDLMVIKSRLERVS